MATKINAQEKQWQRESDARVLAEAEQIRSNPSRLKGATAEAKVMAKRVQAEATNLNKVAKNPTASTKKASTAKKPATPARRSSSKKK